MTRFFALIALLITAAVVADYWGHASAAGHIQTVDRHTGYGCTTVIGKTTYQLRPGDGIKTDQGWRNCQTYDGHLLVIYSAEPPKTIALDSSGG
jgi:hypothetical protein